LGLSGAGERDDAQEARLLRGAGGRQPKKETADRIYAVIIKSERPQ
jgi:hypothetical protein